MLIATDTEKPKRSELKSNLVSNNIWTNHSFEMPVLPRYKISIQNMQINQQCFLNTVQMIIIDKEGHVISSRYINVWFPLNTETSGGENSN